MSLDDSDIGNMSTGGGDNNDNGEVVIDVAILDVEEFDEDEVDDDEDWTDDIVIVDEVAPDNNLIGGVDDMG